MSRDSRPYGAMLSPELAATMLREKGARMTAQRLAVLEILHNNRTHPTAEMVIEQVQGRLGCVSPATIYNTLETLYGLGLVKRIEGLEQRAHFDPDTSEHQHAICRKCRKVWDVRCTGTIDGLPEGFAIEDIVVQGLCPDCAE
ncbi:MAG: Fur family transcriptional regulator [Armatimonadota bacterium]